MTDPDIHAARKATVRWYILRTLENGVPMPQSQELCAEVMRGLFTDANSAEIRREFDYLAKRGLVTLHKGADASGPWRAELTRDGFDVVQYTVVCDAGIARPPKYWKG